MQTVILNGFLGEKYGTHWNMEATTYKDIVACISANYPSFYKDLVDIYTSGADVDIQVGANLVTEEEIYQPLTRETIVITPIPAGSKSGTAKAIIGTVLLVSMFFIPGSQFAIPAFLGPEAAAVANLAITTLAVNLAIVGLQQLLAPDPSVDDDNKDYLFAAPSNTVVARNPVPILCGEMMIGGLVISAGVVGTNQSGDSSFIDPRDTVGVPGLRPGTSYIDTFGPATTTGDIAVLIDQEIQDLRIDLLVD